MDWNDLKVALAVARAGSLNRAAAALQVNQSTVGRRLGMLEAALGTMLFRRSQQGLVPTDAGQLLIARAAEIEARAERLKEAVAGIAGRPAGVVRLLGNQWMIDRLIAAGLGGYLARNPGVTVRTIAGRPGESLWRGDPGLGLWFEARAVEGAFAMQMGTVPYAVYRARGARPAAWVAFYDEAMPGVSVSQAVQSLRRPEEPVRLTALDAETLRAAVAAGIGMGLLPVCIGAGDPRLEPVLDRGPRIDRSLYLHAHPDTLASQRVQTLLSFVREVLPAAFHDRPGDAIAFPSGG